jgi:hypothetical protein
VPGGNLQEEAMLQQENQTEPQNFVWVCQALAATEEICKLSSTCHCSVCGKWFCSLQAEDEAWRHCSPEPADAVVRNTN